MRILERPRVSLKWHTPNPEHEIEAAGRVCWGSWGRSDGTLQCAQDFIRRLKKVGHIDVLEEAEMSVWIECSRVASHQIVRHRTQHHLQASQRYIKSKDLEIMLPPSLKNNGERSMFLNACEHAFNTYTTLCESGVRKEDARFVLPNATLTILKAKANLANWRHFFDLRSDSTSQWEVRMLSNSILSLASEIAPAVFEDQVERYLTPQENDKEILFAELVDRSEFDSFNGDGEY